jgi:alpha-ribazole phosphatase
MSGKIQGWIDIALNHLCIAETKKAGKLLKKKTIHAIYSSPLLRAPKTAEEINYHHNLSITAIDDLKECGFGIFKGLIWNEVMSKDHYKTGGGESIHDVYVRISCAVDTLIQQHKNQTIVIVSHGLSLKIVLYHAGATQKEDFEKIEIKNADPHYISYNHYTHLYDVTHFPIVYGKWVR